MWEMERFNNRDGGEDLGAVARATDLAKAFEWVSLPAVWAWATHFSFPRKILRVLSGYFVHQRRVQFEGCVAEPLRTIAALLPGSKWSCLLLRVVLPDASNEVTQFYLPLKLRVSVDVITALLMEKNKFMAEMAHMVMKKRREEVEKKGLKLSVNENGKEGKEQDGWVVWFPGRRAASMQQGRRSDDGRWCGDAGSQLENQSQELGSERKSEKKEEE